MFARFGVVDTIVTDNGSQFTLKQFKDFCKEYNVEHVTTTPYHPRSNGLAEKFVDTLKRALKKAREIPADEALQKFLQVYRITPNNGTPALQSPAEVMSARRVRSVFDKLLPKKTKPGREKFIQVKQNTILVKKIYFKVYKQNK